MDKREFFLKKLEEIEPKAEKYLQPSKSKLFKILNKLSVVKSKIFLLPYLIFLKRILHKDLRKKIKLFWGREITVYLTDKDGYLLYIFGSLISEELRTIKFLIKNLKGEDVFYDIGANYGFYTLLAQEFITTGEIHSFEPNPAIFELLRINADIKNFPNTYLNKTAVSNRGSSAEFYDKQITGLSGHSSLIKHEYSYNFRVIKVETKKLDNYILDHKKPTVIKIDAEGAEPMILEGSINLLKNYNPLFIIEILNDNPYFEAVKILKNFGYTAFYLDKNGDLQLIEDIFLFMKTEIRSGNSKNIIFKKI